MAARSEISKRTAPPRAGRFGQAASRAAARYRCCPRSPLARLPDASRFRAPRRTSSPPTNPLDRRRISNFTSLD